MKSPPTRRAWVYDFQVSRVIVTRSIALIAACVVMVSAVNAFAAVITVPTSLNPGDKYRLAFVTTGTRDGSSHVIAEYNTFVTNDANTVPALASLDTIWTAIGSTATVDARDNTNTVPSTVTGGSMGVPIFLLNDTKLVDSNDDLWDGSLDVAFASVFQKVWTGSTSDGRGAGISVLGSAEVTPIIRFGVATAVSAAWISDVNTVQTATFPLYAISNELQVAPVPEPSTAFLIASGLATLAVRRRKRR